MDPTAPAPLPYDIAIVGGGVNGCGIARDAAGRGLSVVLFEKGDLASATSSASTKLIHGGLRYLEQYEFRLVAEALRERAVLWKIAPHLVWPLRFILPHHAGLRPRWMLRIGLFIYDHLGGPTPLRKARAVDLATDPAGRPLKPTFRHAFAYTDCWADDARLVVLNALDAAERGADIRVQTEVTAARREGDLWRVETGQGDTITARILVNASGPWVNDTLDLAQTPPPCGVRLVQGSHVVTPRLFDHDCAYLFQNGDGRVVFAIPYEHEFTLIGTTDRDWTEDPQRVSASADEVAYLCEAASEYFSVPVSPSQVIWTYSGVRALVDDGASKAQETTRDYVLKLDREGAPLLSVYGGKITTYRRLAEHALRDLAAWLPERARKGWTAGEALPGGEFKRGGVGALADRLRTDYPALTAAWALRLAHAYGLRADRFLGQDMGEVFGATLTAAEVDYLMDHEWAQEPEDILRRRSKLGLHLDLDGTERLAAYMAARTASVTPALAPALTGDR